MLRASCVDRAICAFTIAIFILGNATIVSTAIMATTVIISISVDASTGFVYLLVRIIVSLGLIEFDVDPRVHLLPICYRSFTTS